MVLIIVRSSLVSLPTAPPSDPLALGGAFFSSLAMTRAQMIRENDELRQHFRGGHIEFSRGPYEIDDRTMGRILCALASYNKFSPDSLHDKGSMIFAGFSIVWTIQTQEGQRVMRVWTNEDVLHGS